MALAQGGNGQDVPRCDLGDDDCPFARSIKWLQQERENRIQTEGHLTIAIDEARDKATALGKQFESIDHDVRMLSLDLRSHVKRHRWVEVLTLGTAMALGSAIAPAITALLAKLATR